MVSGEVSKKMATTHFEVIGVIGVDNKGVRHFRRREIDDSFGVFEGIYQGLVIRLHRFDQYC